MLFYLCSLIECFACTYVCAFRKHWILKQQVIVQDIWVMGIETWSSEISLRKWSHLSSSFLKCISLICLCVCFHVSPSLYASERIAFYYASWGLNSSHQAWYQESWPAQECAMTHTWRLEDNLQELVVSFHLVGASDWAQVVEHWDTCIYP